MEKQVTPARRCPPGAAADSGSGGSDGKLRQMLDGTWGYNHEVEECQTPPPWYDEGLGEEFGDSGVFDVEFRAFLDAVDRGDASIDRYG
jgi:hypothetical protein